uniref:Uncharacterized protein n=1 Tax=Peronospora matthiolae TaxID=2874970 RepID=A0AAV1TAY7_9STRA
MWCAAEAAKKAFACMLAAKKSIPLAPAAGDPLPTVAIEQQAVPVVSSPGGEPPRATDASAASAANVVTHNADEPVRELIYSGESDDVSNSKAAPPASGSSGAGTARSRSNGSGERGGIRS